MIDRTKAAKIIRIIKASFLGAFIVLVARAAVDGHILVLLGDAIICAAIIYDINVGPEDRLQFTAISTVLFIVGAAMVMATALW